ncbi:NAD(P)/FAD-dependent oxidoreductase [Desulfosarcina sp.]|uniref:NAD(P)/FAD-dependent oxidoreductase n=1 Tax=Desulfosarcina sp. TaxID=2027861 RepID=UPI0029B6C63F|nr:NAD(P)/FAD-dependent oxidoreductase [Desulfosarcina sp.]MDX2454664.1 NAD(P)/FAD-dependent oxidoreductase [Desulfosarcina sp.]MDX2492288.1 NAD(P)/FAD-dependent oxidoreductase [Desulfosarcina sp.]
MGDNEAYDVVIVGAGPAGLQAAIHAARKKVSVLVLGKENKSSLFRAHVENMCSLFNATGQAMLETGRRQAENFGSRFLDADILRIAPKGAQFALDTESGNRLTCKALILATGTARNKLRVKGEKELVGKGVSYCVDCDGNFYRGEEVAVVGGESAAADGALTLAEIAGTVHLICDDLKVSDVLLGKLENSRVVVHRGAKIREIAGGEKVNALVLDDGTTLSTTGVFIELGAKGLMELATSLGVALDDDMRFIQTDKGQRTSVPGIFAAGDICGPPWQVAKAVGEGCVAGLNAADYAKKLKGRG